MSALVFVLNHWNVVLGLAGEIALLALVLWVEGDRQNWDWR